MAGTLNRVSVNLAQNIAEEYHPVIHQQLPSDQANDYLDFLTPFMFNDPHLRQPPRADIESAASNPRVYYGIMEDDTLYYIYYLAYHPVNWKTVLGMGWHRHDTEGILIRVGKSHQPRKDIVTVCHYSHPSAAHARLSVLCESRSHCIKPLISEPSRGRYRRYAGYELENIGDMYDQSLSSGRGSPWERLRANLYGVDLPDRQLDKDLHLQTFNNPRRYGRHFEGDIWVDPQNLFRQLERYRGMRPWR